MSLGGDPAEGEYQQRLDRIIARADADRAAREAGHKSLLLRLRERLWPRRQAPRGGQENS
jgi:hypothetical protein